MICQICHCEIPEHFNYFYVYQKGAFCMKCVKEDIKEVLDNG